MKTKTFILIATVILTISSCTKYPEGGSYFFTNNMTKKIAGEYKFIHYYIDGVDSVNYYFNTNYANATLYLIYGKTSTNHLRIDFIHDNSKNLFFTLGGYKWGVDKKNKKEIEFIFDEIGGKDTIFATGAFKENTKSRWDIMKLEDNELIIEINFEGHLYRTELKK